MVSEWAIVWRESGEGGEPGGGESESGEKG